MKGLIPKELLESLACPDCRKDLNYNDEKTKLICNSCKRDFDIKEGIPILLPK